MCAHQSTQTNIQAVETYLNLIPSTLISPLTLSHSSIFSSIRTGFDHPFSGENSELLCTIFSASNYGGGGNSGAYMVFTRDPSLNKRMGVSSDENEEGKINSKVT